MSGLHLRFVNGALRLNGITRVAFQEPMPVQTVTIPVVPEPFVVPVVPEPVPEPVVVPVVPEPVPEPVVVPEPVPVVPEPVPEPVQVAEIPMAEPESKVEAPAEVTEASPESGLVPEDPPAE